MQQKNQHKPLALIVDDEKSICHSLAGVLSDENWESVLVHSGSEALAKFQRLSIDLVLLDVWMKGMDGIETLQKMKEIKSYVPVVIMSGHGTVETAVRATKLGAFDYLEKPLSLEKLLPLLNYAAELAQLQKNSLEIKDQNYQIIGQSEAVAKIHRQIRVVAPRNSWVLITGENGTGKEVVARNIHLHSSRADKPFVAVNCAAIPEELIESELFGYTKGAFTNALTNKKGKFELAHQGTLFLDEIGDMSLKTQAKILRILQEQTFERLGDHHTISIDVRVIAATNKNLQREIDEGHFREDLFYRLNVIPIHMKPLREKPEDIVLLADFFLQKMSYELGENKKQLTEEAKFILKAYQWPGNIRELKNLMERLCVLSTKDWIDKSDLLDLVDSNKSELPMKKIVVPTEHISSLKDARLDFERMFIVDKLKEFDWNISRTAEAIGMERSHLHRKLKTYNIDLKRLKL